MNDFKGKMAAREIGVRSGDGDGRVIGRRLREGYSDYTRYLEILNAISSYGFGSLLDRVRSFNIIPRLKHPREDLEKKPKGVRVRLLFEELGPTFVKLGQVLTTQSYLIPEDYLRELEKLKDEVTPMSFSEVRGILERELGGRPEMFFSSIEEEPVGSASIGQVHRAVTTGGKSVAIKVQRSAAKEMMAADMRILEDMAETFGDILDVTEVMNPHELVRELERLLLRELDYTLEARSIDRFRRGYSDMEDVVIPAVHWKLTTGRVLTMDFVEGIPADEPDRMRRHRVDTSKVAGTIVRAVGRMIFVRGFFHGDLHGGNILVERKYGKVAFLDFGAVGYLGPRMRENVALFYMSLMKEDISRATRLFMEICGIDEGDINVSALEQDMRELLDFQKLVAEGRRLSPGMNQKLAYIALRHGFAPPTQFILLERTLLVMEEVGTGLEPSFDLKKVLGPILKEAARNKIMEMADPLKALHIARDYRDLVQKGPGRVQSILRKLDTGTLTIKADPELVRIIRRDMWRAVFIVGATMILMMLIFLITIMGLTLPLLFLDPTLTALPIMVIYLVTVWWLYARWKGPRYE